jgi:hypothetical protein
MLEIFIVSFILFMIFMFFTNSGGSGDVDLDESIYHSAIPLEDDHISINLEEATELDRFSVPFNLFKNEKLLFTANNIGLYEKIIIRPSKSWSHGLNIRIVKGVSWSPRAYLRPKSTIETRCTDTGEIGITSKHLYFKGNNKSFRVRLNRIVSTDSYSDGFSITKDDMKNTQFSFRNEALPGSMIEAIIKGTASIIETPLK